ncbi:endonuclease/exonuclease/phosphatase family protein [Micromonospora tulbaghiae]|uniref:endonuclease/exonuclease/phosphatase family protein n=1 Tax=Micromonospora tulbaghiae TaxID=479978 RepID=UPI0036BF2762
MRVLTWNLWWRYGDWRNRRNAIVGALREADPDVCGLQEVWGDEDRNFALELAEELGMRAVFAPTAPPAGAGDSDVGMGNAILSRWPILSSAALPLGGGEDRSVCHAVIEAPSGRLPFFTTHLTYGPGSSALRQDQVRSLVHIVARHSADRAYPVVVTGDLNAEPGSDEIRLLGGLLTPPAVPGLVLLDAWDCVAPSEPGYTWSRSNPHLADSGAYDSRIDYIMVGLPDSRPGRIRSVRLAGNTMTAGAWGSDHFAVVADLED